MEKGTCNDCSCKTDEGKRVDLNIRVTEDEVNNIKLISNKVSCAEQAASPGAIPDGISSDKVTLFIKAALSYLGEIRSIRDYWWVEVKKTYGLTESKEDIWVDFDTGDLYIKE